MEGDAAWMLIYSRASEPFPSQRILLLLLLFTAATGAISFQKNSQSASAKPKISILAKCWTLSSDIHQLVFHTAKVPDSILAQWGLDAVVCLLTFISSCFIQWGFQIQFWLNEDSVLDLTASVLYSEGPRLNPRSTRAPCWTLSSDFHQLVFQTAKVPDWILAQQGLSAVLCLLTVTS